MYCDCPMFKRCCFCLPLRKGVLVIGYINLLLSVVILLWYSDCVYEMIVNPYIRQYYLFYHGAVTPDSSLLLCVALYCAEVVASCVLLYGAHKGNIVCLKIFYYYSITATLTILAIQIWKFISLLCGDFFLASGIFFTYIFYYLALLVLFAITGLCIQVYLLMMVWSLVKKLETVGPHQFENQIELTETKVPDAAEEIPDVIYCETTLPVESTLNDIP